MPDTRATIAVDFTDEGAIVSVAVGDPDDEELVAVSVVDLAGEVSS